MMRALVLLLLVPALAALMVVTGCGSDDRDETSFTAAKPAPPGPGLPPVGPASGVIYYSRAGSAETTRMSWDGSSPTVVCTDAYCANGFEVSRAAVNRFLLYARPVASWPSSDGGTQPIYNVFMVPEGGGTPVNIINDEHFQTFTPGISVDDTMIVINGGGVWSEELKDFAPGSIGSYVADLVYTNGYPSGIANRRMVCPRLLGDLAPDKLRAAVTEAAVSGGLADLWVTSLADGARSNLTSTSTLGESGAAWSPVPAADRVAYVRPTVDRKGKVTAQDVYTVLPSGSGAVCAVTKANSGVIWNCGAQWSPTGSQLAFVASATQTGAAAIMRTAADGSTTAANLTGFTITRAFCLKWRP